jgi:hypothetical protein
MRPSILAQRNGEWRYLEFLQVTSLITADIFMREGVSAVLTTNPTDMSLACGDAGLRTPPRTSHGSHPWDFGQDACCSAR